MPPATMLAPAIITAPAMSVAVQISTAPHDMTARMLPIAEITGKPVALTSAASTPTAPVNNKTLPITIALGWALSASAL